MKRLRPVSRIFYVYGLFDENAIIRYIGKGKGERWLAHEKGDYEYNPIKKRFILRTLKAMGKVPGVKIREELTEPEAFEIEVALIRAIGRINNGTGPLTNLTENRNGPSSETMKAWWATQTPEVRSARMKKAQAAIPPEVKSEISRKRALAKGVEFWAKHFRNVQAGRSPEEKRAAGQKGGAASAAASTFEQKQERGRLGVEALRKSLDTPEKKLAHFKKTGAGQLTKEQLSVNGTKGATKLNSMLTPEQRQESARKGAQTMLANTTPEERIEKAKKASKASHEVLAKRSFEEKSANAKKVWEARRRNGTINVASIWINNGIVSSRIRPGKEVPEGWVLGKLKKK